jgi:hypothetical protein
LRGPAATHAGQPTIDLIQVAAAKTGEVMERVIYFDAQAIENSDKGISKN